MFDWFKKRKPESSSDRLPVPEERAKNPVGWARIQVPIEKLVQQMKEPKDVRLSVSSAGAVEAVCKACAEQIPPAAKDGLSWLVCARCQGKSFVTLANLPRDMRLADEAGGLFEYELFFVRNLPPQLSPPNPSRTAPKQPAFLFTIDLVFYNEPPVDRVILAGTVNLGTVRISDSLTVLCQGGGVAVVLEDIVVLGLGKVQQARMGQEVSLILRGIREEQPARGDCVVANPV